PGAPQLVVAADNRTEKATPKRRTQARKKGQVARSQEIVTAAMLIAGVAALAMFGPHMFHKLKDVVGRGLSQAGDPSLASDGGLAFLSLWPNLRGFGSLVGLPPRLLASRVGGMIVGVALRALPAIELIAALDYLWQWRSHEKSLRMSRDEVKQEARESDLAPE